MAKGSFGERLKREREMREVSLDELTKSTRISRRFLEALENEDWNKLPGGVFGRGFVRTIAAYLGLDEENLLSEYDLARGHISAARPEDRIPSTPVWIPILAVLAICALVAALFYGGKFAWRRYAEHRRSGASSSLLMPPQDPSAESPASPTPSPANQPSATELRIPATSDPNAVTPATPEPLDLSVSTSAATRVRILADDKLVLDEELPANVNRHFSAADHFEVTAADSSAVLLELDHQVMRPLGPPSASGTMVLSRSDLRPANSGISQP